MGGERRIAEFRGLMVESGLAGALVSWPPHVSYLTGAPATANPAYLLVDRDRAIAVVPQGIAGGWAGGGVEVVSYPEFALAERIVPLRRAVAALAEATGRWRPEGPVGVEVDRLRSAEAAVLGAGERRDVGPLLDSMRRRKDGAEVDRIAANLAVLAAGFEAARGAIRAGRTELAVWSAVHAAMMDRVGHPFPLDGNFASGPRTLEAEPQATGRVLERGDAVLVDLYPIIGGYCADLTRTFVVGEPTPAQRERHAVLERALAAGAAALRPGVRACDVDAAVRGAIGRAGLAEAFPHHAGHGIGIQAQESPLLIPGDETVIEEGMVVAVEPGVYLPDTGGMRLERNYLVTASGCESLSPYPADLIACG